MHLRPISLNCHAAPLPARLEELNVKRQSTLQRVKAVQKERDSLTGDKEAAEAYLQKERECLGAQSVLAQVLAAQAKVGRSGVGRKAAMVCCRVQVVCWWAVGPAAIQPSANCRACTHPCALRGPHAALPTGAPAGCSMLPHPAAPPCPARDMPCPAAVPLLSRPCPLALPLPAAQRGGD